MTEQRPPSFAEIANWIDETLDGPSSERLTQAIADAIERGDNATAETVRWLARFRDTVRAMPMEEPPPILRQRLRQQFDRWSAPGVGRPAVEVRAQLVYDSRRELDLVGMRGGDDEDATVHLAYRAAGADLVIDVRRHPQCDSYIIDGQVFLDDCWETQARACEAVARGSGWSSRTVDGDELGRFRLERVRADDIELQVTNGEFVLAAAFDLREGAS